MFSRVRAGSRCHIFGNSTDWTFKGKRLSSYFILKDSGQSNPKAFPFGGKGETEYIIIIKQQNKKLLKNRTIINIGDLFKRNAYLFPVKTYLINLCVGVHTCQQKSDDLHGFSPTTWVRSSALTASGFYPLSYLWLIISYLKYFNTENL